MNTLVPDHGTLDHYYIADVFSALFQKKRTGALRLEKDSYLKIVYIADGQIAYASSNAKFDRLGEVLVRRGMLTREQLDDAMKRVEPGKSLGKVLVEIGYLSPKELVLGARLQVYTILDSLFQWDDGVYHFNEGPLPPQVVNLKIHIPSIVIDGVTNHARMEWIRKHIPGGHTASIELNETFYEFQPALELRPNVEEVISWCDGVHTIEEIAEKTGLNAFFIAKVMVALSVLQFGLLKLKEIPDAAAIEQTSRAEEKTESPPQPVESEKLEKEIASALSIFVSQEEGDNMEPAEEEPHASPSGHSLTESTQDAISEKPEKEPPSEVGESHPASTQTTMEFPQKTDELKGEMPSPAPTDIDRQAPNVTGQDETTGQTVNAMGEPQDLREVLGGATVAWSGHKKRDRSVVPVGKVLIVVFGLITLMMAGYYLYTRYMANQTPPINLPEYTNRQESPPPSTVEPRTPPEEEVTDKDLQVAETASPETIPAPQTISPEPAGEPVEQTAPIETIESEDKTTPRTTKVAQSQLNETKGTPKTSQKQETEIPFPFPVLSANMTDEDLHQVARDSLILLRQLPEQAYTIQVELACQPDTVRRALQEVKQPGWLYITPKRYLNKPCFVVSYGIFRSRTEAEKTRREELSPELLNQPSPPQVVTMAVLKRRLEK